MRLPQSFYLQENVVDVAKALLGKVVVTQIDGLTTSGIITETEAYAGVTDRASHAFGGRRTSRTEVMYATGGVAYVYLCYGIHHLFNVVTNVADVPHAVLIRAIEPLDGVEEMLCRRGRQKVTPALTAGPGSLSIALGISTKLTGRSLHGPLVTIEDRGIPVNHNSIVATPRIGVAYAREDALLPYRFYIRDNVFVSKGKWLKEL